MGSRLVNVRLDEERLRKAQLLRKHGFSLSVVIREAIDERFDRFNRSTKAPDIEKIVEQVFEQYPDPANLPPRTYDVHDRNAARRVISERLRVI